MHYLGNGSHGSRLDPTFTRALMAAVRDRGHLPYMFAIRGTWAAATSPRPQGESVLVNPVPPPGTGVASDLDNSGS
jgi:hypothetical protein